MRKSLLSALALSAVLLTSCSNEELVTPGNDGNVVFTVALPGDFATRATISDGTKATKLSYAVYLQGTKNALFTSENTGDPQADPFSGLQTELALNLAKGKTYDIVFWADKGTDSPYTFNTADQTITVDYNNVASNLENRDAFFASETITVTGAVEENITLKRPFAQLNFATSDLEAADKAGLNFGKTQVKVTGVHNTLNLLTGVASDSEGWDNSVTFGYAGPVDNDLHNGTADKKYNWLSMNYFLTGVEILDGDVQKADKETVDCEFKVQDKNSQEINTINIANVPVQRNYRTNIYGELLTSTVNFAIEIKPNYNEGDYNKEIVEVATAADFNEAVIAGTPTIKVPADASIDIKELGNIKLNNQTLIVNGTLNTARAQICVSGEGNVVTVVGPGKITSEGVDGATGNRPLNAYDGGTLIVKNLELSTEQNNGGSVIFSENGNLDLENVKIDCHNFAIGANGGTLKAKNCVFNSDSNNREGAFSYTVSVLDGCHAVLDGVTVNGIQGGVSVGNEGSVCVINGGRYTTHSHPDYTNQTAFYPVYIFDKGIVEVNDGEFISGCDYTIFNGNNDVPSLYDYGNGASLKGGKYNKGTIDQNSKLAYPAAKGYKWVAIEGDDVFKYKVVPEGEPGESILP